MARAFTPTLLSLDRWAMVMGISPGHFNQGVTPSSIFPLAHSCEDIWFQHSWMKADQVGREDLAVEIARAEKDIAEYVGFWPAPKYISSEVHRFPRHYRPDFIDSVIDQRGYRLPIDISWGKFIQAGRRALTQLTDNLTLAYSDDDGDGFAETATVTVDTDLTNACEIKVYVQGHNGDPVWEIRPARTKTVSPTTFTATFWTWQFIDPALWERFPTADIPVRGIDFLHDVGLATGNVLEASATWVDPTIDVYREYCDFTQDSAHFFWEPDPDISGIAGELTAQEDGVIHVRDVHEGIVVPQPAEYDTDEECWVQVEYSVCRPPDLVKVWYLAGDQSDPYLSIADMSYPPDGYCDPLSHFWAQTIAYLATSRLDRPFCSCGALTNLFTDLRVDIAKSEPDGATYFITEGKGRNPFGTRKGEIMAWERCRSFVRKRARVAVI